MSHFVVFALIPTSVVANKKGKKLDADLESAVSALLEPYNENLEVDQYARECYCLNRKASKEGREAAEKRLGTNVAALRESFREREDVKAVPNHDNYYEMDDDSRDKLDELWAAHLKPYEDAVEEETKKHPLYNKPDPECDECHGKGERPSTYNPKSKWDWWQIGGRWTGMLGDYDPRKDPDNQEKCFCCHGTGKRDDEIGRQAREKDPSYTCNGCDGTGKQLTWPTRWPNKGNVLPVSELLAKYSKEVAPYALITPEQEWIERGQMGWWGMSTGDKKKDVWTEEVKNVLEKYKDHVAVVVDCHI